VTRTRRPAAQLQPKCDADWNVRWANKQIACFQQTAQAQSGTALTIRRRPTIWQNVQFFIWHLTH
jgi:hypothetical protein